MNIKRFLAILSARNKEFLRDTSALSWNIIFPVCIVIGFAFAFSGNQIDLYKVGIVFGDTSLEQQENPFFKARYLQFIPITRSKKAISKVERHKLDMLIDLNTRRYWINKDSPRGYVVEKIFLASQIENPATPHKPIYPILQRQELQGAEIRYIDWLIPGVMSMNMMFSALFGVGYVIVRYRKNGVLKRLKATPTTAFEFLSAQVVSRLFLVMFITVFVYIGADYFIEFSMLGSYLNLFLIFLLGAFSLISMGLLVAARIASEELAGGVLNFISWPMMFLSGVWFSLEGIHPYLQKLSFIFPLTHINEAARAIMIDGASLLEVSSQIATLSLMTAIFLILGSFFFRWE